MTDIYNPYIRIIFNELSDKYKIKIGLPKAYMYVGKDRLDYISFYKGFLKSSNIKKSMLIDDLLQDITEYMDNKNTVYLRSIYIDDDKECFEINIRLAGI